MNHSPLLPAEPGKSQRGLLAGPAGALEYRLDTPAGSPHGVALLCHPHPLFQGTMDNKVVYALSRAALSQNLVALRFQFRGVGQSEGVHDHGIGEAQDTAFLLAELRSQYPDLPAVLMGFSFGAYMALKVAAQTPDLAGLVTIAPPLVYAGKAAVPEPLCPWLLVHGDADDVVPMPQTQERAGQMSNQPHWVTMPGAGHFFHGQLGELRQHVEAWLEGRGLV